MVPQATLTPTQAAWMRARAKAESLGTTARALGAGYFSVVGSDGTTVYQIRRLDADAFHYSCTCKGAERGYICYHMAAAALLPCEVALRSNYRRRNRRKSA